MAGYAPDFSMSNNAVAAYDDGLRPASKIPGVPAALVKRFCRYDEWHHSSKLFNRTPFYDPAYVRATFGLESSADHAADPVAVAALSAHKAAKSEEQPITIPFCRLDYVEWSGTGRRKRRYDVSVSGTAVISPDGTWITVGGTRKRADGNWLTKLCLPLAVEKAVGFGPWFHVAATVHAIISLHRAGQLPRVSGTAEAEARRRAKHEAASAKRRAATTTQQERTP